MVDTPAMAGIVHLTEEKRGVACGIAAARARMGRGYKVNRLMSWFRPPHPVTQEYAEWRLRGLLARAYRQYVQALAHMLRGGRCPPVRAADKLVRSHLFPHIAPELREATAWLHREFHIWQGDMPGGWVHAPLSAARAYIRMVAELAVIRAGLERLGLRARERIPAFPFLMKDRVRWASYSASLETREELREFLANSGAETASEQTER